MLKHSGFCILAASNRSKDDTRSMVRLVLSGTKHYNSDQLLIVERSFSGDRCPQNSKILYSCVRYVTAFRRHRERESGQTRWSWQGVPSVFANGQLRKYWKLLKWYCAVCPSLSYAELKICIHLPASSMCPWLKSEQWKLRGWILFFFFWNLNLMCPQPVISYNAWLHRYPWFFLSEPRLRSRGTRLRFPSSKFSFRSVNRKPFETELQKNFHISLSSFFADFIFVKPKPCFENAM